MYPLSFFILALFSFLLPSEVNSQQKIPTSLEPSPQTRVTDRQQKAKSDLNSDSSHVAKEKPSNTDIKAYSNDFSKGGVQIDKLQEVDNAEIGVLNEDEGALDFNMWKGTHPVLIKKLVKKMPLGSKSEVMRNLTRRLLMSSAKMPADFDRKSNWIFQRIKFLMAFGKTADARRLLNAIPDYSKSEQFARLDLEISFLSHDYSRACSIAMREYYRDPILYWEEAFTFCTYILGGADKASLGVSLMRESGRSSPVFFKLVDALITGEILELRSLIAPSPLHLAIINQANIIPPYGLIEKGELNSLRSIAMNAKLPLMMRLKAADKGNLLGIISAIELREIFTGVIFSEDEISNPLSRAEIRFGPRIRSLLYFTAKNQDLQSARAEAVSRALALGRYEKRYFSTVKVFAPLIITLEPSDELLWFAGEAVRALLVMEEWERAQTWYDLLSESGYVSASRSSPFSALNPIALLAGIIEKDTDRLFILESWIKNADEGSIKKANLLFQILDSFDESIPEDVWLQTMTGDFRNIDHFPDLFLWRRLSALALAPKTSRSKNQNNISRKNHFEQGDSINHKILIDKLPDNDKSRQNHDRIGETILLILVSLGEGFPHEWDPVVLGMALKALKNVGFEKEARLLALEALLGSGL